MSPAICLLLLLSVGLHCSAGDRGQRTAQNPQCPQTLAYTERSREIKGDQLRGVVVSVIADTCINFVSGVAVNTLPPVWFNSVTVD